MQTWRRPIYPLPEFSSLPPLPPVHEVDKVLYRGPTTESNWLIYGRLMVGAFPGYPEDDVTDEVISEILRTGITTFVCLQKEYVHEALDQYEWRSGQALRPYIFDAIRLIDNMSPNEFPHSQKPEGLEFIHYPIIDCDISPDHSVLQLSKDLCKRLNNGEKMYVHCYGGHGRTGTVVSIMLSIIYGMSALDSMRWVQFCHDLRITPMGVSSPQTESQRRQVIRVVKQYQSSIMNTPSTPVKSVGGQVANNNNSLLTKVLAPPSYNQHTSGNSLSGTVNGSGVRRRGTNDLLSPQPNTASRIQGGRAGGSSFLTSNTPPARMYANEGSSQMGRHAQLAPPLGSTLTTVSSSNVHSDSFSRENSGMSSSGLSPTSSTVYGSQTNPAHSALSGTANLSASLPTTGISTPSNTSGRIENSSTFNPTAESSISGAATSHGIPKPLRPLSGASNLHISNPSSSTRPLLTPSTSTPRGTSSLNPYAPGHSLGSYGGNGGISPISSGASTPASVYSPVSPYSASSTPGVNNSVPPVGKASTTPSYAAPTARMNYVPPAVAAVRSRPTVLISNPVHNQSDSSSLNGSTSNTRVMGESAASNTISNSNSNFNLSNNTQSNSSKSILQSLQQSGKLSPRPTLHTLHGPKGSFAQVSNEQVKSQTSRKERAVDPFASSSASLLGVAKGRFDSR